jgi:hypothetical protein
MNNRVPQVLLCSKGDSERASEVCVQERGFVRYFGTRNIERLGLLREIKLKRISRRRLQNQNMEQRVFRSKRSGSEMDIEFSISFGRI